MVKLRLRFITDATELLSSSLFHQNTHLHQWLNCQNFLNPGNYYTIIFLNSSLLNKITFLFYKYSNPKQMAGIFTFIDDLFSKSKKTDPSKSFPYHLLKSRDFQDIYNYFHDIIGYYTSIQNEIEGFDRELGKPNWVVVMCEDLCEKINFYRSNTGKNNISINQVFVQEELATSERDYHIKLAIFCSELCIK